MAFQCGARVLGDLCSDLRAAHLTLRPVSLDIRSDAHEMTASRAMLVGLVMNEAITNAVKYAFPDDRTGAIRIDFGSVPDDPGFLRLSVADDGVGPTEERKPKGTGIGQRLMQAVAAQLKGSYILERSGGPIEPRRPAGGRDDQVSSL